VIPVPEAEDLVARLRGGPGPPAHITLVYPFVVTADLTTGVLSVLTERFAAHPSFGYRLARTTRFLDVLFLDPEPDDPFRGLVRALGADDERGERPPYPLEVTDIRPHVTVTRSDDPDALRRAEAEIASALPIACRAAEALVVAEEPPGSWRVDARFPLGRA
jgi:2'-5' RNA ligase